MAPRGVFSGGAIRVMARLFFLLQVLALFCAWLVMMLVGFADRSSSPVAWGLAYGLAAVFYLWLIATPVLLVLMPLTWIVTVVTRRRRCGADPA